MCSKSLAIDSDNLNKCDQLMSPPTLNIIIDNRDKKVRIFLVAKINDLAIDSRMVNVYLTLLL